MRQPAERKTNPASGILSATGAAIKYIALPLFLIYLIQRALPDLNIDFSSFTNGTIVIGIALITTGFIYGYYWKGSQQRLIAGLTGVALAIIWIVIIVGGFNLGASFESFSFNLSLGGMFLIIAAGISLKGIYHFAEYSVYKRELEEEDARQMQQYQAAQYQNSYRYPPQYPSQQSYPPPPPPPPEGNISKNQPGTTDSMKFRHYDDIAKKEGEIEWKKPNESWKIDGYREEKKKGN